MSLETSDRGQPVMLDSIVPSRGMQRCRRLASEVMAGWRDGQTEINATAALAKHPELGSYKSIVLDLAYEEFCLRTAQGEHVEASQFCGRFPSYQKSLKQQIELYWLIERNPSLLDQCVTVPWPEPGNQLLGFRIIDELGQGAFARVYLAAEASLGQRLVAIKVCLFGADEADILGKLNHPNIVAVHSTRQQEDSALTVICMPYWGRATLCDMLDMVNSSSRRPTQARVILDAIARANRGFQPAPNREPPAASLRRGSYVAGVLHLARQLAEALAYAHAQNILHLDLKPSNVLLADDGTPMLLDFNLAQDLQKTQHPTGGTLPYMSPEQLRLFAGQEDSAVLDERTDIFSFGVILYEMLYGQLPFGPLPDGLSSSELARLLLERQQRGPTPPAAAGKHAADSVARLVLRCLAMDPQDRFASAQQLAVALRREASWRGSGRRWIGTHRALSAVLAGSLLLAAGAAGGHLATRDPYSIRQYDRARAAITAGQYEQAVEYLSSALEEDDSLAVAYLARGVAQARLEQYAQATEDLERAYEISKDPRILYMLGYCYNKLKVHESAVPYYAKAIAQELDSAEVYNNLGYSHLKRDRRWEANLAFTQALQRDPGLVPAMHGRAVATYLLAKEDKRFPATYINDIASAVAEGTPSFALYRDAAQMFAYAALTRPEYRDQAAKYIEQGIRAGALPERFRALPDLAPLFEDYPHLQTVEADPSGKLAQEPQLLIDLLDDVQSDVVQ